VNRRPVLVFCCSPRNLNAEKARPLGPLLGAIESLSQRIYEYNQQIGKIAKESYPQVARLEQVKGVGTLIALTYMLTLEDAQRFRKSRDVGCYVGLQPGRRNSGQSEPQLHISKEGDPYLRTLLVQGAHHILGPFGADSDLRRWGLKLAERGGNPNLLATRGDIEIDASSLDPCPLHYFLLPFAGHGRTG
jgi:transposase